ncbi:MAG: alcohol dehydrogenase catalytic domain-containing protein, partial [Microvirga sp.]
MRALQLFGDRDLRLTEIDPPAPPAEGEVQVRVRAIGLNYLDLWGFRGMAFAKRKMPQVVGVEAAGEVAAVGPGGSRFEVGDPVVMYGAETCGHCRACREGRDNLCENVAGIMGFHIDGFARDLLNMPARLVIEVPKGVSLRDAACAPIAFATVQHMLFDNAKLEPGESILVHAGGSGIGTAAIAMAKAIGCMIITTVGDNAKAERAKALGADHVINYQTERFEGVVRKLTGRKGVDVVFEHVGAQTFNGSLLSL